MKTSTCKKFIAACAVIAITSGIAGAQANQAAAVADLARLHTISVLAKDNLADSAQSGNVDAMAQATERSDAVDAAVAAGMAAYESMVQALQNGDQAAATAAANNLKSSVQNANNALNGVVPTQDPVDQWKASTTNTGGGPGASGDTPNIYDKPYQSAAQRSVLATLSGAIGSSSSGGAGGMSGLLGGGGSEIGDIGDEDATPE